MNTHAQEQEQKLLSLLQNISLSAIEATTSDYAFRQILAHICEYMNWPLGHVYIWSDGNQALVSSGIWYMSDADSFKAFRALSEETSFLPGVGTVGRVIAEGKAVTVLDVREDTGFVRQLPVEKGGIRTYFAFPVVTGNQVSAVIEFFSPHAGAPDAEMTSVIYHAGALLGMAIERERALKNLQKREAQLHEAQRMAHIAHWEWDVARDGVTWSEEMYNIFSLQKGAFVGSFEGFLRHVHPDDVSLVQKKVHNAHQDGKSFDYFHRIVRPDGRVRMIHARGRPIFNKNGEVIGLYGINQDITELKEAELQLAEHVDQLKALMEIGQTVAGTLDLNTIYERVLDLLRPLIGAGVVVLLVYKEDSLEIVAHEQEWQLDMVGTRVPLEGSISGDAWLYRKSLHLQGEACAHRASPVLNKAAGDYRPHAILATPICAHDDCVGVLSAAHEEADAFDQQDLRLLETVGLWTAIAIRNARQYEKLRRRLNETDAIMAVSNAMVEALDLDPVLQLIVDSVKQIITHADWTAIHLLRPDGKGLELAASAGLPIGAEEYTLRPGEGIAGQVMNSGQTINIADMQADPRRLPVDQSMQARSLLVSLVENRHRRVGTISVQCATPSAFTTDDERLLKILGIQAGIALDNARLYAMQRGARERAEQQGVRIRQMARRVVQAQEEERARISRELHDEAGQSLTALKIGLELARAQLPKELAETGASLLELIQVTDETLSNLRHISHNLRPPGLDAYGLDAALRGLCEDFSKHTAITVTYEGLEISALKPVTSLALYRFVQEAITNVAKHAQAESVQVKMEVTSDTIKLIVKDDGQGFVPPDWEANNVPQGTGLIGMLERIEMVDGFLEIVSAEGAGTRLTAIVPLQLVEA
jgi:PAS domain S-box-containing protein